MRDGKFLHPTEKDGWRAGLFCRCGAECPPGREEMEVRAALAETARLRALRFRQEPGEQIGLPL